MFLHTKLFQVLIQNDTSVIPTLQINMAAIPTLMMKES